jgi:hypothetical protein
MLAARRVYNKLYPQTPERHYPNAAPADPAQDCKVIVQSETRSKIKFIDRRGLG